MKGLGSYMALPQTPRSLSALNKRLMRNVAISFVTFLLLMCILWRQSRPKDDSLPQQLYPEREDYEYFTSSNFYPVSIPDATKKTTEELCKSFPRHVLSRIQPVLKTGHGDSKDRVDSQMDSVSSCFTPEELLLFSDIDEKIRNHTTIDILSYLPESHYNETIFKSWAPYVEQKRRKILGTLDNPNQERIDGWKLDKFKFLPIIEQAWAMRPNKEFYVFYEMDTYISWDNMFRMLDTYDPDANIYMGSPSPGRRDAKRHDQGTWFGNGGPGYVLSRGAMKTLLNRQVGPHGRYTDSSLSTQYSELTQDAECCGDSVLGYVLWLKKIPMHGLYPMFTPFILPDIPFTEENWCYPIITMHKNSPKEMVDLFKWEFEKRKQQTPLLLADVWDFYKPGSVSTKPNWENGHFNKYDPPNMEQVNTAEQCSKACENDPVCLEWTFYGKEHKRCSLQSSIQNGGPRKPGRLEDKDIDWTAGWMTDRIARWKTEKQCRTPKWPGASVRRVF